MPRFYPFSWPPATPLQELLLAMALMLLSMAFFSAMNIVIRFASFDMHTTLIVFWRNLFSVLILLPWVLRHGIVGIRTQKAMGHFWRGTIGICGMQLWFYCVATLPLNEATALSFTAPIFTTIFAIVFLGEKAGLRRWSAIIIGFFGAMIIIRPDPGNMDWNILVVPAATSLWAIAALLVKHLTRTEPAGRIVFYMALIMTVWSLPLALPFWRWPTIEEYGLCVLIALASTGAHISMVRAYGMADVVLLMPIDFFRLVFTAIFVYWAFGELADRWTWIGGAVIVASAAYIAWREAQLKHRINKEIIEP